MDDIRDLIPQGKSDCERARAAVAVGYPAVAPILPELLEWLQDCNWPVAHVLCPFLETIGAPLIPYVHHVLGTDDDIWKYWMIGYIMRSSREVASAFRVELEQMAYAPSERDRSEELDDVALETLQQHGWDRPECNRN